MKTFTWLVVACLMISKLSAQEKPACKTILQGLDGNRKEQKMKAVGYYESKPIHEAGALLDLEIATPELKPQDILVRVKAVSVNPVDTKQRRRKNAEGEVPVILGWDVAGTVEAVGPEVKNFKVGDEVYYAGSILRQGGNSELHAVDSRIAALKPKEISFEAAASLPLTSLTAYEALFEQLGIKPSGDNRSKTILIIGGAGGVGSIAIQMAKIAGLKVITTASRPETIEWVKRMGADIVLNHRESLQAQLGEMGVKEVDYIFNTANTEQYWTQMAELIKPFGKICSIVESPKPLDLTLLMLKSASFSWELMFTRSIFETSDISQQSEILSTVGKWVSTGQLRPTLADVISPINAENLRRVHALLESGSSIGKTVLSAWQ